ncbi:carbonic anhydrase [Thelephora terrestris]|uniref:Carbonic anhydrase n=1 Tax=Thelephora terrestris TaxID=56493 RepID=A0A9P6HHD9_9AGAM|nr:carbonic anhydrase [Thelephora terrestris]
MSTHAHTQFEEGNSGYVTYFKDKGKLAIPPAKHLAIVTCMDARIDVVAQLGLKEGDAHIIRNAGGSAKDSVRSLIISQRLLGTREIAVFHHTNCGMQTFTTPQLREKLKASAEESNSEKVGAAADAIQFLEFSDLDKSVKEEVEFVKTHPLILKETEVTGWVYHVESGKVRRVV